jgi:hypothetical protein
MMRASTGFCLSCIDTGAHGHRLSGHLDGINEDHRSTLSKNEAHSATPDRGHTTVTMVTTPLAAQLNGLGSAGLFPGHSHPAQ